MSLSGSCEIKSCRCFRDLRGKLLYFPSDFKAILHCQGNGIILQIYAIPISIGNIWQQVFSINNIWCREKSQQDASLLWHNAFMMSWWHSVQTNFPNPLEPKTQSLTDSEWANNKIAFVARTRKNLYGLLKLSDLFLAIETSCEIYPCTVLVPISNHIDNRAMP